MKKIADAINDMEAFTWLTDNVIQQIMSSDDPNLEESKRILKQIQTRQLYRFIGQIPPKNKTDKVGYSRLSFWLILLTCRSRCLLTLRLVTLLTRFSTKANMEVFTQI